MTLRTSLVITGESGDAVQAINQVDQAMAGSNVTVEQAERYMRKASIVLGDMAQAERTAAAEAQRLAVANKSAGQAASEMARDAQRAAVGAGAQRAGMQQLGFQMQDFAVQVAGGTSATRAFAQQMPQAIGAVQLMLGNSSKLGAFMGGPWGVAFAVATSILTPLIGKLFETSGAAENAASSLRNAADAALDFAGASNAMKLNQAKMEVNGLSEELLKLENLTKSKPYARDPNAGLFDANRGLGGAKRRINEINQTLLEHNNIIKLAETENARLAKEQEKVGSSAGRAAKSTKGASDAAREHASAAREAAKASKAWADALEDIRKETAQSIVGILGVGSAADDLRATVEKLAQAGEADLAKALEEIGRKGDLAFDALNEGAEALNEQIDALIGSLGRLGGLGGIFGDVGSILTSKNPIAQMLGMGGIGTIAGSLLGGSELTKNMGIEFQKGLKAAMPNLNDGLAMKIGNTMANVFQGAAIGGSVGGILGGGKGGSIGSSLGGALGQAVGGKLLSSLGAAAGPVGAIVGAIAGNLLGSMLTKAKTGGAVLSATGVASTWGTSSSRESAALGMGGNVMDALNQIASTLGAKLGTVTGSVGVRNDNLIYNPTGSASTKASKGAISFGQDEAAMMKAIVADQISKGAFEGLSEGFKAYLSSGDVESRLQDILSIKGVQQEAAKIRDPKGFELGELDKQFAKLREIATATGEGLADVEFVYGERRKAILEAANDNAIQLERDKQGLLAQIAELEGRSADALAITRKLESDAADASLRPLLDRRNALQDEAVAAADAARRADDLAIAAKAAADALAATQKAIADEIAGLDRQWLEVTGQTAKLRELDLAALLSDDARAKQQLIWAYQDAQVAAAKAQAEQDAYNQTLREAADAARAAQKAISDELAGLDRQWLEVTGQTAKLRELDLAALLSDDARAKQQQIWTYQDAKERQAEADRIAAEAAQAAAEAGKAAAGAINDLAKSIEAAQGKLAAAYQKERGALEQTREKWLGLAQGMGEFIAGLRGELAGPAAGYAAARSSFQNTARMASLGDEKAFSAFSGQASAFLSASKGQAGTLLDYQRDVAMVARAARLAEGNARGMSAEASIQIGKLDEQVKGLIDIGEKTQTVADLIAELNALQEQTVVPALTSSMDSGFAQVAEAVRTQTSQAASSELDRKYADATIAGTLSDMKDLTQRIVVALEVSGIKIGSGSVTVNNTAPIPVDTTP